MFSKLIDASSWCDPKVILRTQVPRGVFRVTYKVRQFFVHVYNRMHRYIVPRYIVWNDFQESHYTLMMQQLLGQCVSDTNGFT